METVVSGIRPTGNLHLGNYFGAVKSFLRMQDEYNCFFFIADWHSLTTHPHPDNIRNSVKTILSEYLACGIDPEKATIYIQSDVPEVVELYLYLNMNAGIGELMRTASFKDKARQQLHISREGCEGDVEKEIFNEGNKHSVSAGLLTYPTLMAADILLYQAQLVPIGKDQQQHLELARTVAERFNNKYSPTFIVPEGFYPKTGAKIYSLLDPTAKMGKTDDNVNGTIFLLDDADTVMRKFKRAVTDSGNEIRFAADKPGISNLLTIYSTFAGCTVHEAEKRFEGKDYAAFKTGVGECVVEYFRPIKREYERLIADKSYLGAVMKKGADKAARTAYRTLSKVYRKVGLVPAER